MLQNTSTVLNSLCCLGQLAMELNANNNKALGTQYTNPMYG